jgi:hypothetical protein
MEQPAFEFSNRQQIDDFKVVRQNFDPPKTPEPKPERVVNKLGDSDPGSDFRAGKPKIERPIGGNNARKEFDAGKPDMVDPIGKAKPKVKTTIRPADAAPVQGDDSIERQLAAINERVKTLERDSGVGDDYKSSMGEATKRTMASHPFMCSATENGITVGQGYIWAGKAFYNWPKTEETAFISTDVDELDFTLADGDYLLGFEISVNPFTGLFTDEVTVSATTYGPYVPTLTLLRADGGSASIQAAQEAGPVFFCIAEVAIRDGSPAISQRWFGDIHLVVMFYTCKATSGTYATKPRFYYECSLSMHGPPMSTIIDGNLFEVDVHVGETTQIDSDWDATEDEGGPL